MNFRQIKLINLTRTLLVLLFTSIVALNLNSCKKDDQIMNAEQQRIHDQLIKDGYQVLTPEEIKVLESKDLKPREMTKAEINKIIFGIETDTMTKNGIPKKMNVEPDPKLLNFYGQTSFSEGSSTGYVVLYLNYGKGTDGGWVPKSTSLQIYEPTATNDIYAQIEMLSVGVNYYDGSVLSFKCGARLYLKAIGNTYSKTGTVTAGAARCCKVDISTTF